MSTNPTPLPSQTPANAPWRADPSQPWARDVNAAVKFDQRMPAAALLNQAIVGYPGDPDVGTQLPGTTINYVDATQIQIAISFYYSESGTVPPSDMQALLVANAGPFVEWNYSYTQFGLPGILTGGASA
jgi:hypothetical protein